MNDEILEGGKLTFGDKVFCLLIVSFFLVMLGLAICAASFHAGRLCERAQRVTFQP